MIEVLPHRSEDPDDWEATVGDCGGNALHLPAVHRLDFDPSNTHQLCVVSDGAIVGCALAGATEAKRWKGVLGRTSQLVLPTAPAVREGTALAEVRGAFLDYARGAGYQRLLVHPLYSKDVFGDEKLAPFRTTAVTEFVLDLSDGEESVLGRMHKNHRKNVRRASRDGVRIVEDRSLEGLLQLRELQMASSDRAAERAEGFGVPGEDFFRRMHENVYGPGLGSVLLALVNDKPVAALAWLQGAGRAQTVRSGSLPEGYKSYAMYMLYAELIQRVIARGAVELNAGGVPSVAAEKDHPQHGLYQFKQGFGGMAMQRYGVDIPLAEVEG